MSHLIRRYGSRGAVLLFLAFAFGYTLLLERRQPLLEASLWGLLVIASFLGYGAALKHLLFPNRRVDIGLLATWGASVMCIAGGALAALSLLKRPVLIVMVEIGIVLAAIAVARGRSHRTLKTLLRFARTEPVFSGIAAIVVGVIALNYLAAVADWHTNPYDDDIAYLPSLQKLLDTGSFPEPFSFRRLSALGGQIVFLGFVAPRAGMSQSLLFDHGISLVMICMLIAGYRRGDAPSPLFRFAAIVFLLAVPNIAINTASYFSGVVFFLGLFRTLVFLDAIREDRPWAAAIPLSLISATVCTLRQNYLPVPVVMLAVSYAFTVARSREAWGQRLREPLFTAGFTAAALLPYLVMAYVSNGTFLFPVIMGNANPALQLKATGYSLPKELLMLLQTALEGVPIRTMPFLFVALALMRDKRPRRPILALTAACIVSFAAVVHSFSQSDSVNIGRYVFAFMMALALVIVLEASVAATWFSGFRGLVPASTLGRGALAGAVVLACIGMEIVEARSGFARTYARYLWNIDELSMSVASKDTTRASRFVYEHAQASVPAGARMAVLADEPYYFDFGRNPIYNLDMPGYASPAPGQPFFQGGAKLADYFRGLSVRYIVFVRPDRSRYHYRREYWIERLTDERELWLKFSPYIIDYLDNLTEISETHRIVFAERELVVVDLEERRAR